MKVTCGPTAEVLLRTFGAYPMDGSGPSSPIQGSDGNFYGAKLSGGPENLGTVFEFFNR